MRYEYEQSVYDPASGLTAAQVAVAIWYGHRKNWKNDTLAWGSAENIAMDIRFSARTVERARPVLEERGWLVDTGERAHNGKGRPVVKYDLAAPTFSDIATDLSRHDEEPFPTLRDTFSDTVSDEQVREQEEEQVKEQVTTTGRFAPVVGQEDDIREYEAPSPNVQRDTAVPANSYSRDAAQEPKRWSEDEHVARRNRLLGRVVP